MKKAMNAHDLEIKNVHHEQIRLLLNFVYYTQDLRSSKLDLDYYRLNWNAYKAIKSFVDEKGM